MTTKSLYLYDRFLVSNQNFTAENVKVLKNPGFLFKIPGFFQNFSNSRFLQVFIA